GGRRRLYRPPAALRSRSLGARDRRSRRAPSVRRAHPVSLAAADMIRAASPGFVPRLVLVLGSGLGALADRITPRALLDYRGIPAFPAPSVPGHRGRLVLGTLGRLEIA